ncbi:hypothetical protein [Thermoflexibacter ruber]|uniref:Uncharacterized protein n=1 Tax=Thermoflexibacter ruber TaxID=1003 RepID=A0A1I2K3V0_9BACT|nr:hypothetical protein [Thermoflexibacter ruber]SFF61772.1 hypothetical protein SAMN04488541_10851 [Thermoflexibacter ruber]
MKIIRIFIFLFIVPTSVLSQNTKGACWEFFIDSPSNLDIYINNIHIVNTNEFGTFYNKDTTFAFELYFRLYTINDTLFVSCSDIYTDCLVYKYTLSKKIFMGKDNVLNKKFKLTLIGDNYKFNIRVNPAQGHFIHFFNNINVKKSYRRWFQQNTEPFEYGSSPPKRVK